MEYANTPSEVSQGGSDGDSDGNVLTNEGGSIVFMSAPQYK